MVTINDLKRTLQELFDECGAVAIKAEFEAEGSRLNEILVLRQAISDANLDLTIKIGGCEAIHDIEHCKLLNATNIMAPMIETPFALEKYKKAVQRVYGKTKDTNFIINAETITCFQNLEQILREGKDFLYGISIGRSDFTASAGLPREMTESEFVLESTLLMAKQAKHYGLKTNVGGNIGLESIPFLLKASQYVDYFETRKVVMALDTNMDSHRLKKCIKKALEFELLYLKYKSIYYTAIATEDMERISRLEHQVQLK